MSASKIKQTAYLATQLISRPPHVTVHTYRYVIPDSPGPGRPLSYVRIIIMITDQYQTGGKTLKNSSFNS